MARLLVGVGIDGDGFYAHFAGGEDHAAGDLATVGDQDFIEHSELSWYLDIIASC